MALSDVAIPSAKPGAKQQKLYDGGGLLLITLTGSRLWIFKYRFAGKEKTLALGAYPDVSLSDACKRQDDAREKMATDVDPGEAKRAEKHASRLPPPIQEGYCKTDPARDLVGAIPPAQTTHFASITEPAKVGEMLRAFDAFSGTFPVLCALRLAPMLFVRPGELRQPEWMQIDLDKGEWRYRVTKTNTDHLAPLATQAIAILRELKALTGNGSYVFSGARDIKRPMSRRLTKGLATGYIQRCAFAQ